MSRLDRCFQIHFIKTQEVWTKITIQNIVFKKKFIQNYP